MSNAAASAAMALLDEEYKHLHPHAFHLQLPSHHKTPGGIPYATIDAQRKARAIVKLSQGLVLKGEFFADYSAEDYATAASAEAATDGEDADGNDDDDDDDDDGNYINQEAASLHQLTLQCQRLSYQLTKLSDVHFNGGITQIETCEMIIRVLELLCATVEIVDDGSRVDVEKDGVSSMAIDDDTTAKQAKAQRKVIIHHDNVGYILGGGEGRPERKGTEEPTTAASIEESLSHPFALPPPARQSLLNVAMELLGDKKDKLRGVSNSALVLPGEAEGSRQRLVLSHHALLRMLLRTAPYLDEHKLDVPPKEATHTRQTVLKKTVNLIRSCRRFFDQGCCVNVTGDGTAGNRADATARQLWSSLRNDLQYHTHSNSCFRALILMYVFHPSKCSSGYYAEVLPTWMECWRNVDRCPEWDYLWMVLFSRARKHLPINRDTDAIWSTLRKHLLSSCKYWLQVPVGGVSSDRSFPTARAPGTRAFPHRLKAFVGMGSRYEEGMDFVGRLTKLLMFCTVAPSDNTDDNGISEGTADILRFLAFVTPYYNPSNTGGWTFPLGAFLHYLSYEVCARVGVMAGLKVLQRDHTDIAQKLLAEEPYLENINLSGSEIVALLDKMLPLCQQALYSKNSTVSHAGETGLLYLAQIDPIRVTPPLLDFTLRALDISSVHLSHQAPAALSALSRLLQPALRAKPDIVLSRLPDILRLTLAGIDGNDQNKSLRTLILYRNLCMWVPVGGAITMPTGSKSSVLDNDGNDGTMQEVGDQLMESRYSFANSEEYKAAIAALPQSSFLAEHQLQSMAMDEDESMLFEEAMAAMSDWALMFLDRIYELLRAAGEQEKLGKGHGGVGVRHTSVDVAMAKNFSRIMKETLTYFFSGMDEKTYDQALRSVTAFLQEETLPFAVKDASLLCQAICSTRFALDGDSTASTIDRSPGLDALVPILVEDLEHKSSKCAIYRLRCLAGAVRYAGSSVLKHQDAVTSAISFALSKTDDRALFKTGCKLLRHTLSSQTEEYPIAQCFHPMRKGEDSSALPALGTSAILRGDQIYWHSPNGQQLDFAVSLLSQFALKRWEALGDPSGDDKTEVNLQQWRQAFRVLRYCLRGCPGILIDEDPETVLSQVGEVFCPKELAVANLILSSSSETRNTLKGLRTRICLNLLDIMCLIAKDTVDCESKSNADEGESSTRQYKKNETGSISTDSKILNELTEVSELILTRRGVQFQSSTGKTIYRGQKEILTDFTLAAEADFLSSILSRSNDDVHTGINRSNYKDGEDSGKTVSRALLVNRIHLCNQDQTANASSQVPRRLRKLRGGPGAEAPTSLFTLEMTLQILQEHLKGSAPEHSSLEAYESLVDGLSALACHPNINVRGNALGIVDFALTRFGWVVKHNHRPTRLLAAIALNDEGQQGVHGIPSCSALSTQVNSQGKLSRLAEVVKGVTKIVSLPKVLKHFQWGAANRFELVKTFCGTQKLLQIVPPEEVAKLVHYINSMFLSYRSKLCSLPRATDKEQQTHEACLAFLLGILNEGSKASASSDSDKSTEDDDATAMHWRDRLVAAWFVLKFVDEQDLMVGSPMILSQIWSTCFNIIEEEIGQPLQRVSLGLLGRLVSFALVDMSQISGKAEDLSCPDLSALRSKFSDESFCKAFGNALVYDHREDSSVGGGHSAQWSSGVEEIIRDSNYNVARRTLFPFNRISQKSVTFKLVHSQLIETILLAIGHDNAKATSKFLLEQAKELVASPPSEDQRNQLVTSAEIFGGAARALIQYSSTEGERNEIWENMLLPFLDEAVVKMTTNLLGAYFDAIRYAIHHLPPSFFFPLLKWSVNKVQCTLWQHKANEDSEDDSGAASAMADRFALQGKWLLIFQAVLAELDNEDDVGAVCAPPFYHDIFVEKIESSHDNDDANSATPTEIELGQSWKYVNDILTPCLLNAVAHPYDKCRDHIASCLFRMCHCHRKFIKTYKALGGESSEGDPGVEILKELSNIRDNDKFSFKEKNRALGTARKFVACCVHWGDTKHEYPEFIIPLLALTFKSLETIEGEVSAEDRGTELELVNGYRYAIADISSSCLATYGVSQDMTSVLGILKEMSSHDCWQIRQASAHFMRNFQGAHKFLFTKEQEDMSLSIAISLLADDRREVSSAGMSTLTGILAMLPQSELEDLVSKYTKIANKSLKKKKRKAAPAEEMLTEEEAAAKAAKEKQRATRQQKSVFVLCAVVLGRPYDTPSYVPEALAALSKHSFEQRASLGVREVVKMVCSEFKRTHTDNWEEHRKQFTQEQLEALEDVVSTPHYYA